MFIKGMQEDYPPYETKEYKKYYSGVDQSFIYSRISQW